MAEDTTREALLKKFNQHLASAEYFARESDKRMGVGSCVNNVLEGTHEYKMELARTYTALAQAVATAMLSAPSMPRDTASISVT